MKFSIIVPIVMLLLAGCSARWATDFDQVIDSNVSNSWNVVSVAVIAADTLTVSNANSIAPNADIVWHGDPEGDRRAQVAAIVKNGVTIGASPLSGAIPVHIQVVLSEFHALTPRAKQIAPSAVHNIGYTISVIDTRSGAIVNGPTVVDADIEAFVGSQADQAEANGQTQKIRITNHIAAVTAGWLGITRDPRREFGGLGR